MRAAPIIVVGKNRSGTKWVSNLLANHSQVVAVQHQRHDGILETNFFGLMQEVFGDIARVENYIAAVECWAKSDFFKATGCDRTLLYTTRPRPTEYLQLFELVMNDMAARANVPFWLQKTSPLRAHGVLRKLQECQVVLISRGMIANLESSIQLARNLGSDDSVPRAAFRYVLEDKLLDQIRSERETIPIEYEALRGDTEGQIRRLCERLNLVFEPAMLESRWRPNTSFRGAARRRFQFTLRERRMIQVVSGAAQLVPARGLTWLRDRVRNRGALFVSGSYREIAQRYDLK